MRNGASFLYTVGGDDDSIAEIAAGAITLWDRAIESWFADLTSIDQLGQQIDNLIPTQAEPVELSPIFELVFANRFLLQTSGYFFSASPPMTTKATQLAPLLQKLSSESISYREAREALSTVLNDFAALPEGARTFSQLNQLAQRHVCAINTGLDTGFTAWKSKYPKASVARRAMTAQQGVSPMPLGLQQVPPPVQHTSDSDFAISNARAPDAAEDSLLRAIYDATANYSPFIVPDPSLESQGAGAGSSPTPPSPTQQILETFNAYQRSKDSRYKDQVFQGSLSSKHLMMLHLLVISQLSLDADVDSDYATMTEGLAKFFAENRVTEEYATALIAPLQNSSQLTRSSGNTPVPEPDPTSTHDSGLPVQQVNPMQYVNKMPRRHATSMTLLTPTDLPRDDIDAAAGTYLTSELRNYAIIRQPKLIRRIPHGIPPLADQDTDTVSFDDRLRKLQSLNSWRGSVMEHANYSVLRQYDKLQVSEGQAPTSDKLAKEASDIIKLVMTTPPPDGDASSCDNPSAALTDTALTDTALTDTALTELTQRDDTQCALATINSAASMVTAGHQDGQTDTQQQARCFSNYILVQSITADDDAFQKLAANLDLETMR